MKDVGASKYIDRTVDRITEAGLSNSSANLIPAGHLIVVTRMGLGKVGINRVPLAINQDLRALRLSRLVSIDYCYLFLKAHNFEGTGMTVKGIRVDDLLSVPFPLPPFPEQVRIVARVDQLLALCEALEDADRRHHETRRCLVVSVSRRLAHPPATGPATLRADGRFYVENLGTLVRNAEDVEHLQDTLLALGVEGRLIEAHPAAQPVVERLASPIPLPTGYRRRRKIWKEGGLDLPGSLFPPLPSGWVYKTIEELYDLNVIIDFADGNHGSLYPRKTEFADHGVTFVTAKDIAEGRVMWQTCAKLREDRAAQLQKGWSRGGDVLLTHNATVGRVARVEDDAEPFLLGTSVTFYRLNEAFLLPQFFFYVLKSPLWQRQLEAVMQQTTRNQVSIQKQAQFRIPLAPVEDQERVVSRLDELLSVCRELEERLKTTARRLDRYAEATLLHLTAG